ncbi:hypothetical protein APHAL10511_007530 [Amanita phalloides]|nr:hypothetical protein APHAL10511_007530 [Amanita phalloides]
MLLRPLPVFFTVALSYFAVQAGPAANASATAVAAAGGQGANSAVNDDNAQTSLTLDQKVIATGFENNGQNVPAAGQVASLTSNNNFINFCLTSKLPLTNGQQIKSGSCNPAPMGLIPSNNNMPSAKFKFPTNLATIKANTQFAVQMAINNMQTGFFVNPDEDYFSAPQQLNAQGQIQGHSHVVIEQLSSLDQTTPTNPQQFVFFKGLNDAAQNGILTATVTGGLPAGSYKISSINTAANHQPVLVPIAQHGSLDDAVYFSVTDDGNPPPGASNSAATATGNDAGTTAASSTSATTTAAAGNNTGTAASSTSATTTAAAGNNTGTAADIKATADRNRKDGAPQPRRGNSRGPRHI